MIYKKLAIAGLLLGLAVNANATPVTFDLAGASGSQVSVNDGCLGFCGVNATLNSNLGSLTQTLSAGDDWTFDFFTLNFYGFGGVLGATVNATLGFDQPAGASGANGSGIGGGIVAFGHITAGALVWDPQPGAFTLADGTRYSVFFENLAGIDYERSVDVHATVSLLDEPNGGSVPVPEPGTLALLGLGVVGLGFAGRRRRVKNSA